MKKLAIHIILLLASINCWGVTIDQTSATALNQVRLYKDSSFVEPTRIFFKEGDVFNIIDESLLQHPDADQKQKFKWYKIKSSNGDIGWIFGDGLAVFVAQQELNHIFQPFHQKKVKLSSGFENATTWIASIQGRDNFHQHDYMNPLYNEYYLVATNHRGRSVLMKCAGESARGETLIQRISCRDITGDGYEEFIIQRSTLNNGSHIEEKEVEIFSMKAGTLASIFLEHMSLAYEVNVPSPALYKFIEIENQSIRVSYIDYMPCQDYSQNCETDARFKKSERCMEYVTTYYNWDKRTKTFKNLYGSATMAIQGGVWKTGTALKKEPQNQSATISYLRKDQSLTIIKHYEKYVVEQGQKKIKNWFYVKDAEGIYGYIPAEKTGIASVEHADILNLYYSNPPLSKLTWNIKNIRFLKINLP